MTNTATTTNTGDTMAIIERIQADDLRGDITLISTEGEMRLYKDADGVRYISDGGDTYSEFSDDFWPNASYFARDLFSEAEQVQHGLALSEDQKEEIRAAARETAKGFVEEFGEALDPAETDWDSTAWSEHDQPNLSFDLTDATSNAAWKLYQEALVDETEQLANAQ